MDIITINKMNIGTQDSIDLICLHCGKSQHIVVPKEENLGRMYKVKCACGRAFSIIFNRRKSNRKKIKFIGTYSIGHSFTNNIIEITDLSRGGLSFIRTDKRNLAIGDQIDIRFNLDNQESDPIECNGLIKNILDNRVNVEIMSMKAEMRKVLGFYLL